MTTDWYDVGKSPGGKRIQRYCHDEAKNVGLELERTSWSTDVVANDRKYILTITATSGTTELRFAREEINEFASADVVEITAKISSRCIRLRRGICGSTRLSMHYKERVHA